MFLDFFLLLRQHSLPVTLSEYLTLLAALRSNIGGTSIEAFYFLSKITLVKRELHLDLFDRVFGEWVAGKSNQVAESLPEIPPDWLKNALTNDLSDEEKAEIQAKGGLDTLWEQLRKLLDEQESRHDSGSHWIGNQRR